MPVEDSPYPQRHPPSQQPLPLQQPLPSNLAGGVVPNLVIVEGFPPDTQEFVLQLYLANLCQTNRCTEVKMYGNVAMATFPAPVGRVSYLSLATYFNISL